MAPQTSETEFVGAVCWQIGLALFQKSNPELYSFLQLSSEILLVKGRFPLHVASGSAAKQPYFCLFHREQITATVLIFTLTWSSAALMDLYFFSRAGASSCLTLHVGQSLFWMGGFCTLTLAEASLTRLTRGRPVLDRLPVVGNVLYS